jgi:hypothetical protein
MYIETKIEAEEKPSIVENMITGNLKLLKSILVNKKEEIKMSRICLELLKSDIELRAVNLENTINAQQITAVVDGSILFRSLGGVS